MSDAAAAAGRRAVANTALRSVAELVGKFGSFILFAAIARTLGAHDLGQFVLAFAFVQIVTTLVDLGSDRLVIRRIALDHGAMPSLVADMFALKLALAVPVYGAGWLVAALLAYEDVTQQAIRVLSVGLLLDSLNRTVASVFLAHERGGLLSAAIITQRLAAAALGIAALIAGFGVVTVCATYGVGAALGLAVGLTLLTRRIGRPRLRSDARRWPGLLRESVPFALYDSLMLALTKIDTVILSLLTTSAAIAAYGGASRLYEASFFATFSLSGSFQAMFTYLTEDSDPPIYAVFERALKFALVALLPLTVAFAAQSEPIATTLFGEGLRAAADPLRLLAPSIVLMGLVSLGTMLVALRTGPGPIVPLTLGMLVSNVALNVVLIPPLGAAGAALAMSLSLLVFSVVAVRRALRLTGAVRWTRILVAPVTAACAMTPVAVFAGPPLVALVLGALVYAGVYLLAERRVAPEDAAFIARLVRRETGAAATSS